MKVQVDITYICTECTKKYTESVGQYELATNSHILDYMPDTWRAAKTSSNTTEVFCSEKCARTVLP